MKEKTCTHTDTQVRRDKQQAATASTIITTQKTIMEWNERNKTHTKKNTIYGWQWC